MSRVNDDSGAPRAMIHRRILDVAETQPDASLAAVAEEVSGATETLVERVLSEYGDPADDGDSPADQHATSETGPADAEQADATATETGVAVEHDSQGADAADDGSQPDAEAAGPDGHANSDDTGDDSMTEYDSQHASAAQNGRADYDLSDKQRETLRLVAEHPEATQGEIADALDVTRATVSRWLNDIPGFEWRDRRSFVASAFDDEIAPTAAGADDSAQPDGVADDTIDDSASDSTDDPERDSTADVQRLRQRVDALESNLDALDDEETDRAAEVVGIDPDLAHRVMHACLESDRISEDEELRLLRTFMRDGA